MPKLRLVAVLGLLCTALFALSASSARAADGDLLREITAANPQGCKNWNIGIAFDGTNLLVSCTNSNKIDVISPSNGANVGTITVPGQPTGIGALAYDASGPGAGKLWACRPAFGNGIVTINPVNGAASNPITSVGAGCADGLAFDGSGSESLYYSGDGACLVGHSDTSAIPLGGSPRNVCSPPLLGGPSNGNSGIAVGGSHLYMATPNAQQIWRVDKTAPSSTLFKQLGQYLEDMECDSVTFPGKSALWVINAFDRVLRALEIPDGSCNFGGVPPPDGILKVCKVAGSGIANFLPYTFTANGGPAVTVPSGPSPGGYCNILGAFPPGTIVTVQENASVGSAAALIGVEPVARLVAGSKDVAGRKVKVKIGSGVTEVTFTNRAVKTGYIEICKKIQGPILFPLPVTFHFEVPGIPGGVDVPPNACSPPIKVTAGSAVAITEQPPFGWSVASCSTLPAPTPPPVCSGSTATVKVAAGGVSDQTIVTFVNKSKLKHGPFPGPYPISGVGVVKDVAGANLLGVRTGSRARRKGVKAVETVSLSGIDVPSFTRLGAPEECGGRQATNALLHLAFGEAAVDTDADGLEDDTGKARGLNVTLLTDRSGVRRDSSKRLLAYVHDARSGNDLATRLITLGWARRSAAKGSARYAEYGAAQTRARRAKRGVWRLCGGDFHRDVPPPVPGPVEPGPESPGGGR